MKRRGLQLTLAVAASIVVVVEAAEPQKHDVYYLAEWKQPSFQLTVLRRTPMLFSRDENRVVAYLTKGQTVTVIALGETLDYVAARTVTDPARGWVDATALQSPPAELLDTLRQRRGQIIAHQELIARHEVAIAMTRDEVRASLGKPERRFSGTTSQGEREMWVYPIYRYLPTYSNRGDPTKPMRQGVTYERTVVGRKVITFKGDEVVAISDESGSGSLSGMPTGTLPSSDTGKSKEGLDSSPR